MHDPDILRSLVGRGASVTAFPYDYPVHKVAHQYVEFKGYSFSQTPKMHF